MSYHIMKVDAWIMGFSKSCGAGSNGRVGIPLRKSLMLHRLQSTLPNFCGLTAITSSLTARGNCMMPISKELSLQRCVVES